MGAPSVLLVQPDACFARLLAAALEDRGFVVRHASCGRAALAACDAEAPDVVATEVDLADLDGLELIAAVRALPRAPAVVVLSQRPGVHGWHAPWLQAVGAVAAIARPARMGAIVQAVASAARQGATAGAQRAAETRIEPASPSPPRTHDVAQHAARA